MGPALTKEELVWWVKSRGLSDADAAQLLAVADERDMFRAECASISAEFGLPPTIRPAEGEITRMRQDVKRYRKALREIADSEPFPHPAPRTVARAALSQPRTEGEASATPDTKP